MTKSEAQQKIILAGVAGLISGFMTLIVVLANMRGNKVPDVIPPHVVDIFIIFILTLGIFLKSRVTTMLMFIYFLSGQLYQSIQYPHISSIITALIFLYFYFEGVRGSIVYHHVKVEPKTTTNFSNEEHVTQKGYTRSFPEVLFLSIITAGIYFLYWQYINLKEIKSAFIFDEDEYIIETAKNLFFIKVTISIICIIITLYFLLSQNNNLDPMSLQSALMSTLAPFFIIQNVLALFFFYYFTATVSFGQSKAYLKSFRISSIYNFYVIGWVAYFYGTYIRNINSSNFNYGAITKLVLTIIIPFIFYLYCYLKIQLEINKIWLNGKFCKNRKAD